MNQQLYSTREAPPFSFSNFQAIKAYKDNVSGLICHSRPRKRENRIPYLFLCLDIESTWFFSKI